jgi:hypothetical protein
MDSHLTPAQNRIERNASGGLNTNAAAVRRTVRGESWTPGCHGVAPFVEQPGRCTPPRPVSSFPVACVIAAAGALLFSSAALGGVFHPDGATTLHFAFEGSPNGDRPIVRPPAFYHAEDGFGFVDSPTLIGTARGVTAPKYFRFDVNLPAGTYDVTVTLGGTPVESVTSVKAEDHQPMVQDVRVARGGTVTKTFTVTVKRGAAGDTSLAGDQRLTLEFDGTNPSLMKLDIKPAAKPPAG